MARRQDGKNETTMHDGTNLPSGQLAVLPLVAEFIRHVRDEKQQSPNTVKAYTRDLAAFTAFCGAHYGEGFTWKSLDRQGLRGFLGELNRRGQSKRSAARALSAVSVPADAPRHLGPRGEERPRAQARPAAPEPYGRDPDHRGLRRRDHPGGGE